MATQKQATTSPWSLRVGTIAGIPIRIHFTFILFLAWIWILSTDARTRVLVWLIPAIFLCVLLHELGHALTARKFGVRTRDITLYPIGGVAMLQGRRPKPIEEFWIAIAGPAVNVVIAAVLLPAVIGSTGGVPKLSLSLQGLSFVEGLFMANVILPLFNMIPAFPMDGGRVLRAVLAMRMPEQQATKIAGNIGQALAIGLGFVALFKGYIILMLVAFFVFLGAGQEVQASVGLALIVGHRVRDAMITKFARIQTGDSMERAAHMLLEGSQQDFPVVLGEEVHGLLTRQDIARGLAVDGPSGYVSGHMKRDYRRISPNAPLERALELFNEGDNSPILCFEEDQLVGMLTGENLSEFLMLEHARSYSRRGDPQGSDV
ncbi:MAG TPA: site-2 protease family protein [Fimbriimonadaceae bacterium]|nr:site-2 protease family protein [Fimbriimonadaceae bacterium]